MTSPRCPDANRRAELYRTRGWCPVPWAHHPPEIKAAIRTARFVPQLKACHANAQRLVLWGQLDPAPLYCEGYVTASIPIQHAWVLWRGEIVELTLHPDREHPLIYHGGDSYDTEAVRRNVVETGLHTWIDERRMFEHHPMLRRRTSRGGSR